VYVVSDDGIVWTQGAAEPVVDLADAPWAPLEFEHALPRSVVVDDSGNWQLFFEISWFDRVTETARTNIGRVVAASPTGSWTFDAEPLIRPDEAVVWRSKGVASPSVARVEGGFVMLFVGVGDPAGVVVGIAQSRDGATWDVRPGPVFAASQGWEGGAIARVDLVAVDGGLAMFYSGDTTSRRGLALSTNGLDWDPYPANPVLTTADVPRGSMFDSEFIVDGSDVLAYIEGGGRRTSRQVVVLRLNLDLPMLIK
jgi:predicted GH43/DUF377 family glycosyl hydrolase